MALINDNSKFIFFHLYKCGGMSMRKFIQENSEETYEIQGGHSLPIDMKRQFEYEGNQKKYDDYFKFTFIRNPFDFMISVLFYAKTYSDHYMHYDAVNMDVERFIPYYMNFRDVNLQQEREMFGSNRVVTFKDWLIKDGQLLVDFVGKLENINEDLKVVSEKIGIDSSEIPFINENNNRSKDYRQYYNSNSKKMIEKYFGWELDYFKYTF